MIEFKYDTILEEEDLCNYQKEKQDLVKRLQLGQKLVMYGRRNTGKTSLLKSSVIPKLRSQGAFVLFADLYGVRNTTQIAQRLNRALETSLLDSFPVTARLKQVLGLLKQFRPVLKTDPLDGITVSLEMGNSSQPDLSKIFHSIRLIAQEKNTVLVIDEFQDIYFAAEAEGILRDLFQNLPSKVSIVILGSKKHLLSKIFAKPNAPLSGFGQDYELPIISDEAYFQYIKERFKFHKIKISLEMVSILKETLQNIPESINIVCDQIISLQSSKEDKTVTENTLYDAIKKAVDSRQSRYEELLSHYTDAEQKVLAAIAKLGFVLHPSGSEFLLNSGVSQKGASKIFVKLEDHAMIYKLKRGYCIGDPLLGHYLKRFR